MRRLLTGLATVATLAAPAGASAARAWQTPQPFSQSAYPNLLDGRGLAIDGSGNALFTVQGSPYRYLTRAHAGAPSSPLSFPSNTGLGQTQPLYAMDGGGNAIAWNGQWYAYRPAGGAFTGATNTSGWQIIDVAMAPTGEAFALLQQGATLRVAFRPAGAATTFDIAGGTDLPPAQGDVSATGVGVAIDADGGGVAVYASNANGGGSVLVQSVRAAGGSWGNPSAVPGFPQNSGQVFDKASDGSAVLGTVTTDTKSVVAAVRAPGGGFGTTQTLTTVSGGDYIGSNTARFAAARGGALVAWNHFVPYNGCGGGAGGEAGWEAKTYYAGGWHDAGGGPHTQPTVSTLGGIDAAGDTIGLLADENHDLDGDRCTNTGESHTLRAYVGTLQNLTTASTAIDAVDSGDANHPNNPQSLFMGVGPGGDALVSFGYTGNSNTDFAPRLVAYEDPAGTQPGGGGSGGGGGTGGGGGGSGGGGSGGSGGSGGGGSGGGGSTPITAPAKVILHGALVVHKGITPIQFHCNSPSECLMTVTLLSVKNPSKVGTAAKAKTLGSGKAKIKPGKDGTVKVKLSSAGKKAVKKAKKHRLKVTIKAVVTVKGKKTTITKSATLKG